MTLNCLTAILFDLDGTLAETEPLWLAAKRSVAQRHDIVWTEQDNIDSVGQPTPMYAAEFVARGAKGTPVTVAYEISDEVARKVATELVWRPGVLDLLTAAHNSDVKTAIVTMAYRCVAEAVAKAAGSDMFTAIVAGDEIRSQKPHPEPYLRALELLGIPAQRAVAIEDTTTGATSALAAGLLTLVVGSTAEVTTNYSIHRRTLQDVTLAELDMLLTSRQNCKPEDGRWPDSTDTCRAR